jgi:hypothetical protein
MISNLKTTLGADFIYQLFIQAGYEDICLGRGLWDFIPEEDEKDMLKAIDTDSVEVLGELIAM